MISEIIIHLGAAIVGLIGVLVGYVGVVLMAALKADTPELQRYRSDLLRELLKFIHDLCRDPGKR